mgnify:CR=1 FL=1
MLSKIKDILSRPCKNATEIQFNVTDYDQVITEWNVYKKKKKHKIIEVNNIFHFHLHQDDHIILYHSAYLNEALIMCKINDTYKNITIPFDEESMFSRNFIATYV